MRLTSYEIVDVSQNTYSKLLTSQELGKQFVFIAYYCGLERRNVIPILQGFFRWHGPLARYLKLQVGHASGMPGTFFPPPRVSDPDMHNGTCVAHVPWCKPGSLTSHFLWSRWQRKRSFPAHSRRMRNPQFYVSGKRPIGATLRLPQC